MAETDTVVARPWVCQYDGCPAGPNDPPCDCNGCVGARLQAENEALCRERDKLVIDVEKLLLAKLGRSWTPTGISIVSLIDELAAAREAAEARAARLKEALTAQRAFILHWTDDVNGGLKPTLGSLRSALDKVDAALEA